MATAPVKTRERLSREAIAAGALALADREGLDAVTIRRLAQDNSVTPMALYWHFKDKDAVFDGIAERLYSEIELPPKIDEKWHKELRSILIAVLEAVRAHPLAVSIIPARIMKSEAGLALSERVIGLLRGAGFSPAESAQVGTFLLCSIITLVTTEPSQDRTLDDEARDDEFRGKRARLESLSPKKYPSLLDSVDFFLFCPNEDEYFARGIDFLVAGTRGIQPS